MANSDTPMAESTLTGYISKFWTDAATALREMPRASRWFHIFWLSGPLILLIERSPADAWLTICALTFAVRAVIRREADWLKIFWVRAVFAFWGVCLLSAGLSDMPAYSLGEAFIWIRFPLFAMATCFWLGTDKRLLYAMMGSTMLGMIIMTGILTAEVLIVGQQGGRLSWPYGDLVPGNYLAKAGLPAFCVVVALAVSGYRQVNGAAAIISFVTIILSVITGERINFLIRACGGMLAGLLWRPKAGRYVCLILIEILAVMTVFMASPTIGNRFVDTFIKQLPSNSESPYYDVMNSGMVVFETAPVLGIGTANYRMLCPELTQGHANIDCDHHPHNYYVQMLAETGLLGFAFGCMMIGAIIWFCFVTSLKGRGNAVSAIAFIIPFGLFFPIQSTADFFGQWNNIFMWSALALALAARNLIYDRTEA